MKKLSILIPLFNEEKTVEIILQKVINTHIPGWQKEIIVIDDGSTDKSYLLVKNHFGSEVNIYKLSHQGRGRALIHGISHATGDAVIFQDADLEYDPADWPKLLSKLKNLDTHVVFGSRVVLQNKGYFFYIWGARVLTWLVNLLYGARLTDMYTCYKLFTLKTIKSLHLTSNGFGLEPEIVCQLLKKDIGIVEVPIRYSPRTFQEGKKITARDGIAAFFDILTYKLVT